MAENIVSKDRAEIDAFIAKAGKETLPASTEATAPTFQPMLGQEAFVQPKSWQAIACSVVCKGKRYNGRVIVMDYADVQKYVGFAHELYETEEGPTGKQVVPFDNKWQRKLDGKRVGDAKAYLRQPTHYFPPVICVPSSDDTCSFDNGQVSLIGRGAIAALDGQHRVGAIHDIVEEHGGLDSESLAVVILDIVEPDPDNKPLEMENKRQLFADINRTPKKVSKSLNLAFDNSDRVAKLAKDIINYWSLTDKQGNAQHVQPFKPLIDIERATPLAKSNHVMSLTNLYNLIGPATRLTEKVKDEQGVEQTVYLLSEGQVRDTVEAILDNLPEVGRMRQGRGTFEQAKKEYVFLNSTMWQALGNLLESKLLAMETDGKTRKHPSEQFATTVGLWIAKIEQDKNWRLAAPIWQQENRRVVLENGKSVGTQRGYIKSATEVLKDLTE